MTFIRLPIILFLSLLLTCSTSALADESVKIHLKWLNQFQSAGYLIALDKGFYRDEGLNVTLIEGGPGHSPMKDCMQDSCNMLWLMQE